jgi:membrane protease YdiL (CAAX protease family)
VHPAIQQQVLAPQPNFLLVMILFCTPNWLVQAANSALMKWPAASGFCSDHLEGYLLVFWVVQVLLIAGVVIFTTWRYSTGLWKPFPGPWHRSLKPLLLLVPLIVWHVSDSIEMVTILKLGATFGRDAEFQLQLADTYAQIWTPLAQSLSLQDVVCTSILSLVAPAFEEIVFTGFLLNATAKRWGFLAASTITPFCFTLAHIPSFGIGMNLVPLLCALTAYTIIRLATGSLLYAVIAHMIINAVVFFPKWIIAFEYFRILK